METRYFVMQYDVTTGCDIEPTDFHYGTRAEAVQMMYALNDFNRMAGKTFRVRALTI